MTDTTRLRGGRICPHGDDSCPCTDGDPCHYVSLRITDGGDWEKDEAMPCPISGVVDCAATSPDESIHNWFGLSYANYLVLPRAALQSMPGEWQHRFVAAVAQLFEAAEAAGVRLEPDEGYRVRATRPVDQPLVDAVGRYDRGRRRLW